MAKWICLAFYTGVFCTDIFADDLLSSINPERASSCDVCRARECVTQLLPWLEIGSDLRFRAEIFDNKKLDENAEGHDNIRQRYRLRFWSRMSLDENLDLNLRLVTEPYYYTRPDLDDHYIRDEVLFDQVNLKWTEAFDLPMTVIVGRQDIRLGSGWLFQRGTTLDGSRTCFFDAARLTYDFFAIASMDLVYIENHANSSSFIRPFNDRDIDLEEQDSKGAILYLSGYPEYDLQVDGYFIYKHDYHPVMSTGSRGDTYTFGSLAESRFSEDWGWKVEAAKQFGNKNGKDLSAFATKNYLTCDFHDEASTQFQVGYEYLSGGDDKYRHFDKLWGRNTQWSELYNGGIDTLDSRKKDSANLHRVFFGLDSDIISNARWSNQYNLIFADQNLFSAGSGGLSSSGKFKGQLFSSQFKIKTSKHIQHRINAELFLPGNYYSDGSNDVATYLRYELMFTW